MGQSPGPFERPYRDSGLYTFLLPHGLCTAGVSVGEWREVSDPEEHVAFLLCSS